MAESPPIHSPSTTIPTPNFINPPQIPIEIIPDEEMSLIEAAMAAATATRSIISTSSIIQSPKNVRSIDSITLLSKRRFSKSSCSTRKSDYSVGDIEDLVGTSESPQKKRIAVKESLLSRFRRKRALSVTDFTVTEWCEKQMEFKLKFGPQEATKAMKVGSARHAALEDEVSKKVKVHVTSYEDLWALKFMNFIIGSNQLLFDGLARELPIVCFEKGVWMVGVIDEIRMVVTDKERYPKLVDTKTRVQDKLPAEPQRRNGRLQLMCYKLIWDNLVAGKFPVEKFYNFFSLNRHQSLSADIRENAAQSGIPAETIDELVGYFRHACSILPPAHDQLLLRYELQEDQSLIGEDQFDYDENLLQGKLNSSLEFWRGVREPAYAPPEERWKCNFCKFSSVCPTNANVECSPPRGDGATTIHGKDEASA